MELSSHSTWLRPGSVREEDPGQCSAASQRALTTRPSGRKWRLMNDKGLLAQLAAMGGLSPDPGNETELLKLFFRVIRKEFRPNATYASPIRMANISPGEVLRPRGL